MRLMLTTAALSIALLSAGSAAAADPPGGPVLPPPAMSAAVVAGATDANVSSLDRVLTGDWRSDANKLRDRYRHPAATLSFIGVTPDQTVIEIWPSGGWYAEILAPLLRDHGSYIAAIPAPAAMTDAGERAEAERNNAKLRAVFAARPDVFGKAQLREFNSASPQLGAPGSADVVLTFRNVHNWVMAGDEAAMFKAFYAVLKPGGILGVVDHRANPDQPPAEMKTSGYLPEAFVVALAEGAGFKLAGKSEINANPADTKDYAGGVWTLPPTLSKHVDDAKYKAIGESDRMTLRFIKPAN